MSGAQLAIDDWSQLREPIDDAHAQAMLQTWQAERAKLGFGYFRSGGGIMQTGLATLGRATAALLTLDTGGSRLVVLLEKARFEFGNLGFMTPDFRAVHDVEGLSVYLGNNDWLCGHRALRMEGAQWLARSHRVPVSIGSAKLRGSS